MFKVNVFKIFVMFLVFFIHNTSNSSGLGRSPEDLARYLHVTAYNRSMNEFRLEDVIVTQGNLADDGAPARRTSIPSLASSEFLFKQGLRGPQATILITGKMGRFTLKVNQNFAGAEAGEITQARWVYKLFTEPDKIKAEGDASSVIRGSFGSASGRVIFDLFE